MIQDWFIPVTKVMHTTEVQQDKGQGYISLPMSHSDVEGAHISDLWWW